MSFAQSIQQRAARRLTAIRRRRSSARYHAVLGRLVAEGLLATNEPVQPHREPIRVADALWVGDVEPRVLELLPALLARRPSMFLDPEALPDDLATAVGRLRRNLEPGPFRGIEGERLLRWLPEVGRTRTVPARPKCFRLRPDDLRILQHLAERLGLSETEVIRRGLRALL